MKHTLLAFDTESSQGKVRHTLMGPDYGYTHVLSTAENDLVLSLPVNALSHSSKSTEQAINDAKEVCQTLGVTIKKCLAFEVAEVHG